jgi:hypothetical protein
MLSNVVEFISHHPLDTTDDASIETWKRTCETAWSSSIEPFLMEKEKIIGSQCLGLILDSSVQFGKLTEEKRTGLVRAWSLEDRNASIQHLLHRPQIEQRTESWYQDALGLLSASQFHTILKPTRSRGQIVLQKASCIPIDSSSRRTVMMTCDLNPFTWGIRFEPVVKQIYQHLTSTSVIDLGRLKHRDDPRLAASPDGLVVEGPPVRMGRFVEFKAPVTRQILKKVPDEYISQMQIQMEVGNVEECDYLEVKVQSQYQKKPCDPFLEDAVYRGFLYVIGDEEGHAIRYEYSPLNPSCEWNLQIEITEQVLETVPWCTSSWFLMTVGRSRTWFESVQPAIQSFWEDVAKAKEGTFVLPPSSRKTKEVQCKIVDDTQDETMNVE